MFTFAKFNSLLVDVDLFETFFVNLRFLFYFRSISPKPASFSSMASFDGKLPEWILQLTASFGEKWWKWMPQLKAHFFENLSEWTPQLKEHIDGKLSEWTPLLAHYSFSQRHNWLIKCPKYLFDCCPLVKTVDDDFDILDKLRDFNPVQAFSYILLRKLAEFIAQLVASWLIIIWVIAFMTVIWLSLFSSKQVGKILSFLFNGKLKLLFRRLIFSKSIHNTTCGHLVDNYLAQVVRDFTTQNVTSSDT